MKKAIISIAFLLFTLISHAQSIRVSGVVLDDTSAPLYGASVTIKGTNAGVITDENGRYEIQVGRDASLVFSCLGFAGQTIEVKGQSTINVVLRTDNTFLESAVDNSSSAPFMEEGLAL